MKNIFYISIILIFISCKITFIPRAFSSSLETMTLAHIKLKMAQKKFQFNKDKFQFHIKVREEEDLFRNSKYILDIQIWNKEHLINSLNDSIFTFQGVDVFFGETDCKFQKIFQKRFKYLVTDKVEKETSDKLKIKEPISEITVYFDNKGEITYIDPGYDTIYYNLLRNKITFSKVFIDNIGKDIKW